MFLSLEGLIARVTLQKVIQCLDRDLDGEPDPDLVAIVLSDTNKACFAILNKKGYTREGLQRIAADDMVRRQAAWIGAEYMALMKTEEISADGTTLYTKLADRARKELTDIALAILRPEAERTAGAPSTVKGQIFEAQPAFEFAASEARPRGTGGF